MEEEEEEGEGVRHGDGGRGSPRLDMEMETEAKTEKPLASFLAFFSSLHTLYVDRANQRERERK